MRAGRARNIQITPQLAVLSRCPQQHVAAMADKIARVSAKLQDALVAGDYYGALQMYRTIIKRYVCLSLFHVYITHHSLQPHHRVLPISFTARWRTLRTLLLPL